MAGNAENPVRIGPFRRIVEVGWPSNWLVVSGGIVGDVVTGHESVPCSPFVNPSPTITSHFFMTAWQLEIANVTVARHRKASSAPVTGEAVVSGMPTPESFNFGSYEWATLGTSSRGLVGQFVMPSGATVSVPGYPALDGLFYADLMVDTKGLAHPFTGAVTCSGVEPGVGNVEEQAVSETHQDMGEQTIDFGGVSVVYKGKTYMAVGLKVTQVNEDDTIGKGDPDIGPFQILCAADQPTA